MDRFTAALGDPFIRVGRELEQDYDAVVGSWADADAASRDSARLEFASKAATLARVIGKAYESGRWAGIAGQWDERVKDARQAVDRTNAAYTDTLWKKGDL